MAVAGKLDAIAETLAQVSEKFPRGLPAAVTDVPRGDQLRVRVDRNPCPNVASLARDFLFNRRVDLLGVNETPNAGSCGLFATNQGAVNGSQNLWGWMAGIGLEYGLSENWSANIEYDYLGFGTHTVNLQGTQCVVISGLQPSCGPTVRSFAINQNMQLLKFGVNYRFN
jgi:opacity protein-like surface antigen